MRVVCPTCQAEYELPPKTSFRCSCGTLLSVDARGEFHWRVSAPGGGIGKAVLIVFAAAALLIAAAVAAMLVLRGGATKTVKSGAPALRGDITVELRDGVRLELVKVEAGTFTMGDRRVTLNNDYYIGMTEVTQEQWYAMMGPHRARFRRGSRGCFFFRGQCCIHYRFFLRRRRTDICKILGGLFCLFPNSPLF